SGARPQGSEPGIQTFIPSSLLDSGLAALRPRPGMTGKGHLMLQRRFEIGVGLRRKPRPQRLAQLLGYDLLDLAVVEPAQFERPVADANEPVHLEPEVLEHLAHLAVLALANADGEPDIGALLAVERRLDRPVVDAGDADAVLQAVERLLRDAAERAHAVAPQPAGRRQLQHPRQPAVIGEQQQALAVDVEPANADEARQPLRQGAENGRAP